MVDIEKYLHEKGEKYRIVPSRNPQYSLDRCICCWDERRDKFYISCENWQRDCKLCSAKWNFNQYRKLFGDEAIKLEWAEYIIPKGSVLKEYRNVDKSEIRDQVAKLWWSRPEAVKYLIWRGIKESTLKYFSVGVNQNERFTIPILENWKVVDIISWKLPGDKTETPKYLHDTWSKLSLLNRYILEQEIKPKEVFITEWSFDAMTIFQEISENVVWNAGGCDYLWKDWTELFIGVQRIFIIYDTDKGGKRWAANLAKFLWLDRCVIINLPDDVNDVNDYFYKSSYTKEQLLEKINKHRIEEPPEIVKHISEYSEELLKNIADWDIKWISTGIKALDDILWWYKAWHLILLAALTSVWKTTYSSNLLLALAYMWTWAYFSSLEMTPVSMTKKILQMAEKIKLTELENVTPTVLERAKSGMNKLWQLPIYLFDSCGIMSYEIISQGIIAAVEDYGIKIAFIDYLQYFQLDWKNRATEVWDLVNKIKQLAMKLGITIILLSQLNRSGRSKQKKWLYIPTLTDLKESSTLEQSADSVIFICRDNEATTTHEQSVAIIKVAKNREWKTGYFSANYDGETGIFSVETKRDYLVEYESNNGIIEEFEGDYKF